MSGIKTKYLNKTVVVKRTPSGVGETDSTGDLIVDEEIVIVALKIRITDNVNYKNESQPEYGKMSNSNKIGFCNVGNDIRTGDIIYDGTKKYFVDAVDSEPGGVMDHHMELYLSYSEAINKW